MAREEGRVWSEDGDDQSLCRPRSAAIEEASGWESFVRDDPIEPGDSRCGPYAHQHR